MSDPRTTVSELGGKVIDRRRFLAFSGAIAGTALYAQARGDLAQAAPPLAGYPFRLGVASGDPLPGGVSLWTRLAPEPLVNNGGMSQARLIRMRRSGEEMQATVRWSSLTSTDCWAK